MLKISMSKEDSGKDLTNNIEAAERIFKISVGATLTGPLAYKCAPVIDRVASELGKNLSDKVSNYGESSIDSLNSLMTVSEAIPYVYTSLMILALLSAIYLIKEYREFKEGVKDYTQK